MVIDAKGLGCPKPVIMAEEALAGIDEGIVEVIVDNEASVKNLAKFASKNSLYSETSNDADSWRVKIVKGYPCEITNVKTLKPESSGQASIDKQNGKNVEKDTLIIIGSDTMGKDEEIGRVLMKAFFETMKVTKEIPHTIFFLNAGVKLTTVNEEIVSILKELAIMGVEIFTCGTCLKHYGLEFEIKVGYRGTTNHIVEGIMDFKKTVWIG